MENILPNIGCYNLKTLEQIQRSNSCIKKTQENSIESSVIRRVSGQTSGRVRVRTEIEH